MDFEKRQLRLAHSNVPGRMIMPNMGALPKSAGFGALPKSVGFGAIKPGQPQRRVPLVPRTAQHSVIRRGRFTFAGLNLVCQCGHGPSSSGSLGSIGSLGTTAIPYSSMQNAMAAALKASASAQKPVALASIPTNGASAVPVIHTVALSPQVAANFQAAAAAVKTGNLPTPAQAVNMIKAAIPKAPNWNSNVPTPSKTGTKAVSNLKGLGMLRPELNYGSATFGRLGDAAGAIGSGASLVTNVGKPVTVKNVGADTAAGATIGSAVVPGIGTAIGAAVGAIVGLVGGLFGHKKVVPTVSAQDIQNAQNWMAAYTQVAGSVVGRNFTSTMINDLMTAIAILDPGFWGRSSSNQVAVPAVSNFVNDEMPKRLNDFFNAMMVQPVGGTVTMQDDCSILGHGGKSCHPQQTYTFQNPGVNAPSYVLGPIFSQYFFTMCTIFDSPGQCAGHLTAPIPQLYTDIIDWFRSSRPAWDTPQPNVVTGTDLSVAAPTQVAPNQYAAPQLSTPVVTQQLPSGASVQVEAPTLAQTQAAFQESASPTVAATTQTAASAVQAAGGSVPADTSQTYAAELPSLMSQGLVTTTPQSSSAPVDLSSPANQAAAALTQPALAGMNWLEIALLLGVAVTVFFGSSSSQNSQNSTSKTRKPPSNLFS